MEKQKKEKPKKHYAVYYIGKCTGVYAEDYQKTYLGDVWAVSEKQACSWVRYRYRDKQNPNGGYAKDIMGDYMDEGFVTFSYKAEEI